MLNRREFNRLAVSLALLGSARLSGSALHAAETAPLLVASRKKPTMPWKDYETRTIAHLKGFKPRPRELNRYGGIESNKTQKTGFWHVEKIDGRFWMVDPDGGFNIHRAVCSVSPSRGERNVKAFQEKFKTKEAWAKATRELLWENGFNGTGSWSDTRSLADGDKPLATTMNLSLMSGYGKKRGGTYQKPGHTGYPNDCIFAFDPEFAEFCEDSVARQVKAIKDNPYFLGYFSDNEMPFSSKTLENYLGIENKSDPGRIAAEKWLSDHGKKRDDIDNALRAEFLGFLADRYISIVAKAVRKHDPNHILYGPRLHGGDRDRKELMQAFGKHIDVISFNYYGVWTPLEKHTKGWTEWTGKPFMVTEWYTKGEDSGLGNTTGAGWNVRTQKDRGLFYQNYTLALLECGNCVGWHWFKYQDNDPTAKNVDPSNIDSNKGIVDNDYTPYADLLTAMKEINTQTFDLIEYFDRRSPR